MRNREKKDRGRIFIKTREREGKGGET